ncbi:MAG TPA: class I SAM-dependent methyltransferase [Kofleriaceae bacterium]|nr:class I SAM-dependent methyltransferase [Kofleriaceae bacterium]
MIREVAELFGGEPRATILFENFDKHRTELALIQRSVSRDDAVLDLGGGVGVNLISLRRAGHRGRLVLVDHLREYGDHNRMGSSTRARELLASHAIELHEVDVWPAYHSGFADHAFAVATSFCMFEHLPGHPQQQLAELARIVRPGGEVIVGVPNAASLMKRVRLLAGHHPYAPFSEWMSSSFHGHFREYTARECEALVATAGLSVVEVVRSAAVPRTRARNRYYRGQARGASLAALGLAVVYAAELAVPSLRDSIYVVATKR